MVWMFCCLPKGTQTSHYDRKATEGITQRDAIGRQPQHRGRSLAEFIMTGAEPSIVEQETNAAMMFIKEEVRVNDSNGKFNIVKDQFLSNYL